MKLTTAQLRQIIKEEASRVLSEMEGDVDPNSTFCVPCGKGPFDSDELRCPDCKEPLDTFGDLSPEEQESIRSSM